MTVLLIDGRNAVYRFGWVHRNLTSSDGQQTGAVYGMLRCLLRLKKKFQDGKFVVVWDGENRDQCWRKKLFSGYKQRNGTPSPEICAVVDQIPLVQEVIGLVGIPQIAVDEVEADDLIGILATRCVSSGYKTVIYSSDRDYLQLIGDGIQLIRDVDKTDKLIPESQESVEQDFRCTSRDVVKVRALCGDSSDCIPGVLRGIGPVKASILVANGIDPSRERFAELPKTARLFAQDFKPYWDTAHRNYKLMKISTSCDDLCWSDEKSMELREAMLAVEAWFPNPLGGDYKQLLKMLGELGMQEAIGQRQEIWSLRG